MKDATNNDIVDPDQAKPGQACTSVFVVDKNSEPLMPCKPGRARVLLNSKRADVFKMNPFTIRILDRDLKNSVLQKVELKVDPGSKTTGLVLMVHGANRGWFGVRAWELSHRGQQIRNKLLSLGLKRGGGVDLVRPAIVRPGFLTARENWAGLRHPFNHAWIMS